MVRTFSPFVSKLDTKKDICFKLAGIPVIIELNHHSLKQGVHRNIFESSVTSIVKKGFHRISRLQPDERFLMVDKELGITIVGTTYYQETELVISIVSVLDEIDMHNPYNTLTIAM